jgi:hypothetical protein
VVHVEGVSQERRLSNLRTKSKTRDRDRVKGSPSPKEEGILNFELELNQALERSSTLGLSSPSPNPSFLLEPSSVSPLLLL